MRVGCPVYLCAICVEENQEVDIDLILKQGILYHILPSRYFAANWGLGHLSVPSGVLFIWRMQLESASLWIP